MTIMEKTNTVRQPLKKTQEKMQGITRNEFMNILNKAAANGNGHKNGNSGIGAHWQAIRDDKGRVMVAISYNSDIGDSWEFADDPWYPAKFSDQSIRMGVNYIVYSMTH